jgi:putative aminopeptidase FrvX
MRPSLCSALAALVLTGSLHAQSSDDSRTADALSRWIALPAAPGAEELAAPALGKVLVGWTHDRAGNWIKRVGQGTPRRVVACGLDVTAYVVSQITDDGYVRLHRSGTPLQHPLADQFLEATRVRIHTASKAVPGVVAIANGHFARQHRADTTVVSVDQLWVDLGASSRAEVERLGVALLDPVIPDRAPWTWAGRASGPGAALRAGCAAVATAAQGTVSSGETIFMITTQHTFGWNGLTGALRRMGLVNEVAIVDLATRTTVPQARVIRPRVGYAGSLVESISGADASALLQDVVKAAAVTLPAATPWVAPAEPVPVARVPRRDAYDAAEQQVMALLDLPGVPGHEWRVRNAIRSALPKWAADRAVVDSAGNLIVAVGPERDSVAFVAHTDEVSFEVERILTDGSVTLTRKGGVIPSAWEGQPAMLVFDPDAAGNTAEPLRGVFVPRDSARVKSPPRLLAWFGLDSTALVARGVRTGSAILGLKRAVRLAGTRVQGRASDDRTGSTALLMAAQRIDPAKLTRKVILVWTTGEEGGLLGARAFAATSGAGLSRVYAIDTFVSSDTPLEQPTFAYTPLGKGAVLRGLDDGSVAPRAERERVQRVAKANNIPLQLGTTHGSTDGSAIGAFGAPNLGLSWPGRYSHTPGEVLDLRDLDALIRLIAALAIAP